MINLVRNYSAVDCKENWMNSFFFQLPGNTKSQCEKLMTKIKNDAHVRYLHFNVH